MKISLRFSFRELKDDNIFHKKKLKTIIKNSFVEVANRVFEKMGKPSGEGKTEGFHWRIFKEEKNPNDNSKWASLADSTIRRKKRAKNLFSTYIEGYNSNLEAILRRSNEMANDFLHGLKNPTVKFTDNTITVGSTKQSNCEYAKFHQKGTKKMPARPFIPDIKAYERIGMRSYLSKHLHKLVKKQVEGMKK